MRHFHLLNLTALLLNLCARNPLKLAARHFGNAQIIVEHGLVHGRAVLPEHGDALPVFCQKQRGTQSRRPIANNQNICHN